MVKAPFADFQREVLQFAGLAVRELEQALPPTAVGHFESGFVRLVPRICRRDTIFTEYLQFEIQSNNEESKHEVTIS